MPIVINVVYSPEQNAAGEIRLLFCKESAASHGADRNPLTETPFNTLLAHIAQVAFDEGRRFAKEHPDI